MVVCDWWSIKYKRETRDGKRGGRVGRTLGVSGEDTVRLCVRELILAALCAGV